MIQLGFMKTSLKSFRNISLIIKSIFAEEEIMLHNKQKTQIQVMRLRWDKRKILLNQNKRLLKLQQKLPRLLLQIMIKLIYWTSIRHQLNLLSQLISLAEVFKNKMMDLVILLLLLQIKTRAKAQWLWIKIVVREVEDNKRLTSRTCTKCTNKTLIQLMTSLQLWTT